MSPVICSVSSRQADRLKVEFPASFTLASKGVKSPKCIMGPLFVVFDHLPVGCFAHIVKRYKQVLVQ